MSAKEVYHVAGQHAGAVNGAVFIPAANAAISVADDKNLLIWLQRSNGQFWPSVHQALPSEGTCLAFDHAARRLFVGTGLGAISEYAVSLDYNSAIFKSTINAHSSRVEAIILDVAKDRIFSVGKDKTIRVYGSDGTAVTSSTLPASPLCLVYDDATGNVFAGDTRGGIAVMRMESNNKLKALNVLEGHKGAVTCLQWNSKSGLLMSGSADGTVMLWDIDGAKGDSYELHGHTSKVQGLSYQPTANKLISVGLDGAFIVWDLSAKRISAPSWNENGKCELCNAPFMWNIKGMWSIKSVSITRQHHCRRCGKAVCHECSNHNACIPKYGFEHPARICKECFPDIADDERKPLAKFFNGASVIHMQDSADPSILVTCNADRSVSVWEVASILKHGQTAEEYSPSKSDAYTPTTSTPPKATTTTTTTAKTPTTASKPGTAAKSKRSDLLSSVLDDDD